MQTFTANQIKDEWGIIHDTARKEPVSITKRGRPSIVMISNDEYESLRRAAFVAEVKAKLEEGKEAIENGDFSELTIPEIAAKARKEFEQGQGNGKI